MNRLLPLGTAGVQPLHHRRECSRLHPPSRVHTIPAVPKEWPPPRDKWFPGFTAHRDGWVRSYNGRTLFVAGRNAGRRDVEAAWDAKRKAADAAAANQPVPTDPNALIYRQVLSRFMDQCETRVKTRKPRPMSRRTLHNYDVALNDFGNFIYHGAKVADMLFADTNSPDLFAAFAREYGEWKASGFDSIVSRLGALYNWAVQMDYIPRYRPGPAFKRPHKGEIRDDRIDLTKSYAPAEIAKMYLRGNAAMRCFIGLGVAAAMNNAEVSHLDRPDIDLSTGVIDFRRRKTGKVRRVIPLPADVLADLKSYVRPEPADPADAEAFFLTQYGRRYSETRKADGKPTNTLSRIWRELERDAGVTHVAGRSFSGLRTTSYNLMPGGEYETERKVVMGRAHGTIDLDSYYENVALDRVRHVVEAAWDPVRAEIEKQRAHSA